MVINVINKAEQGYDRNIGIALVQNLVCILGDQHTGLDAQLCKIANILTYDCRIYIDCTNDLCSMLMQVTQNVLAHFTTAILYNFYLFHKKSSNPERLAPTLLIS